MQSKLSCLREFTKRAANLVELITRQRRRVLEQRLAYVVDAIIVQPEAIAAVGPIDEPLDSVADVLSELLEESFAAAGCVRSKRNAIRVRLRRDWHSRQTLIVDATQERYGTLCGMRESWRLRTARLLSMAGPCARPWQEASDVVRLTNAKGRSSSNRRCREHIWRTRGTCKVSPVGLFCRNTTSELMHGSSTAPHRQTGVK